MMTIRVTPTKLSSAPLDSLVARLVIAQNTIS
jgi:hypothetical protein